MKDRPLGAIDELIAEIAGIPIEELAKEPTENGRHLITVEDLRAAGALEVPPAWRKSLGSGERDLFSDLFGDDEQSFETQSPTGCDDSAASTKRTAVRS